jgi:hypothetical protein
MVQLHKPLVSTWPVWQVHSTVVAPQDCPSSGFDGGLLDFREVASDRVTSPVNVQLALVIDC